MDRRLIGIGLVALAALGIVSLALQRAEPAPSIAAAPVEPAQAPERARVEMARRAVDAEPELANPRAPVPSPDAPALPVPAHEAARLDVSVVQPDGLAVPFEMVVVAELGAGREWRALTDAEGRAAVEVPSGIDLAARLEAEARDTQVASLSPGEVRPVRIVAEAALARVLYGRVVGAGPVDQACVRLVGGSEVHVLMAPTQLWHLGYVSKGYESAVRTDLNGDFSIVVPARDEWGAVLVEALDKGPKAFLAAARGTSPEQRYVVALSDEARIRGRVPGYPGGEATIVVPTPLSSLLELNGDVYRSAPQVLQWADGVSANGTFELTGLPGKSTLLHVYAKWLGPDHPDNVFDFIFNADEIAPGQVREVEIELE